MNFPRATAFALDTAMCAMMFALQRRHKRHAASRLEIEEYLAACEGMTRDGYFAAPAVEDEERSTLKWPSPIATAFPANDRTHIDLFPCPAGWRAPTVLRLHALMSASDRGYRRWAAVFNARGLERALRASALPLFAQAARALQWRTRHHRRRRAQRAGSVGSDFRWAALMEPIADVGHAIWNSPTGTAMRRELRRTEIGPGLLARLFPLVSPSHAAPLCENGRVIFLRGRIRPHRPRRGHRPAA